MTGYKGDGGSKERRDKTRSWNVVLRYKQTYIYLLSVANLNKIEKTI